MNILVTGANGYIGGRISEYLSDMGNSVTALVHHRPKNANDWEKKIETIIEGDAADHNVLGMALESKIDCIVHTISLDHRESGKDPFKTLGVNVGIFWQLLKMYAEKGGGKVIYLSTQQVYGKINYGNIIDEDSLILPVNPYGLTHKYCEDLCSLFSHEKNIQTICFRISNGFGAPVFAECNCWWLVLMDFCKTAFQKNKIRLLSDGSPQRDFIQIDDICRAIDFMVGYPKEKLKYNTYNLGSGKTHTIIELAHAVSSACKNRYGKDFPIILPDGGISKKPPKFTSILKFKYDISRMVELGFNMKTNLNQGINNVLDYLEILYVR